MNFRIQTFFKNRSFGPISLYDLTMLDDAIDINRIAAANSKTKFFRFRSFDVPKLSKSENHISCDDSKFENENLSKSENHISHDDSKSIDTTTHFDLRDKADLLGKADVGTIVPILSVPSENPSILGSENIGTSQPIPITIGSALPLEKIETKDYDEFYENLNELEKYVKRIDFESHITTESFRTTINNLNDEIHNLKISLLCVIIAVIILSILSLF